MAETEDRVPCEDFTSCGVAQFQNKQHSKNAKQQDSYFVIEDVGTTFGAQLGRTQRIALYGVADGHGEFGEISANFVRRNMPALLAQSPHYASGRLGEALIDSFTQTDALQQAARLPLWASGTCVSAAAVSPTHIAVANCGDCRCVLVNQGTAQDLSTDHNVDNASPEEIQRIISRGGVITPDRRVTFTGAPGRLAATRSLGDYWAKPQGGPEKHIISGLPEVRIIARQPGQQYLLLASDGIFGFMSSQEAVSLCMSAVERGGPTAALSSLAHTVVGSAVSGKHSDDNCTCVVVDLSRIPAVAAAGPTFEMSPQLGAAPANPRDPGAAGYLAAASFRRPPSEQLGRPADSAVNSAQFAHSPSVGSASEAGPLQRSQDNGNAEECWCPWCWRMNRDGNPENVTLGAFEKWRLHMHEQHFDKLGGAYGPEDIVPCYWCCRPCVTKRGQSRSTNRLPFWGSHERVCRENPNKSGQPADSTREAETCDPRMCKSSDDHIVKPAERHRSSVDEFPPETSAAMMGFPPPDSASGGFGARARYGEDISAGARGGRRAL